MSLAERLARQDIPTRLSEIRSRLQDQLVEALGPKLYDTAISERELEDLVHDRITQLLADESTPLSTEDKLELTRQVGDGILGLGPLEPFLRDPTVSEIMVNDVGSIYIERDGKLEWTGAHFFSEAQLRHMIDKIVSKVGRRIDESSPFVDARLPDGSRVNAIIPPLALNGPALTIRKFAADPYTTSDLVDLGTFTPTLVEFLEACVKGRMNVLVSGGTGSGKTTTLNVLSSFIPADERIITIEDAAELRLQQPHVVRLESRPSNIEGAGAITIRDLVRNSLRMRPDRIVVGEVRGGEALDMLQAMHTGHDGSISTIHSNSPRDALARLETMMLMAGLELTVRAVREQAASAIDMIIHQARFKDGIRRVTHVSEVLGMEGDVVTMQDIFAFDLKAGVDAQGAHLGTLEATGLRPAFMDRLEDRGLTLPATVFETKKAAK